MTIDIMYVVGFSSAPQFYVLSKARSVTRFSRYNGGTSSGTNAWREPNSYLKNAFVQKERILGIRIKVRNFMY